DVDVGVHVEEAKLNALEDNRIEGLGLDTVPFLLFTGSSHAGARIDHLVAAFNDLRARGHDLAAVLVGDDLGTIDEMVDRTAADAIGSSSYRDDIHLLGAVRPAMRRWLMDHATAIVLPGELIGFDSGLGDAAATGRPLIATDHPVVREQIGAEAVIVPPRWEALSAAIESVLDDDPAASFSSTRGGGTAESDLGAELVAVLRELAGAD